MLKKIAVADRGEFWYADYKDPLVEFEGGYGYVGAIVKDDNGRLLCHYCGKTYAHLGRHAAAAHGITAREYKQEVGLLAKSALMSEPLRADVLAHAKRRMKEGRWDSQAGAAYLRANPSKRGHRDPKTPELLNKSGHCYEQILATARSLAAEGRLNFRMLRSHGIHETTLALHGLDIFSLRRLIGKPDDKWRRWTTDQLITGLRGLAFRLGRTPSRSDLARYGMPSERAYSRRFGSYSEACRKAGLDPNLPVPLSTELEISILTAYATIGNAKRTAATMHLAEARVLDVLHRHGYPFPPRYAGPERKEWAADMARRLAGWPEETAA